MTPPDRPSEPDIHVPGFPRVWVRSGWRLVLRPPVRANVSHVTTVAMLPHATQL